MDLAAEVQDRIRGPSNLRRSYRAKSQDTLLGKAAASAFTNRTPLALSQVSASMPTCWASRRALLAIADSLQPDQPAIHDLRDHPHAGYRVACVWLLVACRSCFEL